MEKLAEEEKVIYTPYANLPDPHYTEPALDAEYDKALGLIKVDYWKSNYEGLELLRILNKFYFGYLSKKLDEIDPWIQAHLDSLRSGILKMTLLFIQELAGCGSDPSEAASRSIALKGYLPRLIPVLFVKLLDSKKFIVKEVETCLKNVVTTSCSPEVVTTLCEQCFLGIAKGTTWSDNVMAYLELGIVTKGDKEILEKCKGKLFPTLSQALETGRKAMNKRVETILAALKKNCGAEDVTNAIKDSGLSEGEQQKLLGILAGKVGEKKKPEGGLKAFIQSMKNSKQ